MNKTMRKILAGGKPSTTVSCPSCTEDVHWWEIIEHIRAHRNKPCFCCSKMINWLDGWDIPHQRVGKVTICESCLNHKSTPPANNEQQLKRTLPKRKEP